MNLDLTVNGKSVQIEVVPRTNLADLLREKLRFTGTNVGCEQGVCGSCMVLLDDVPVRSCLLPAVSCQGQEVRSIEGLEHDEVTNTLRAAFKREHGLQCGFCTPGMLIASRDIVLRLPNADEKRIRHELSGNLCRCTGYIGIVNAVHSVIESRRSAGARPVIAAPVVIERGKDDAKAASVVTAQPTSAEARPTAQRIDSAEGAVREGWTHFAESFVIHREPQEVWRILSDFGLVASCMPGAELTEHDSSHVKGRMTVKLGPIRAEFSGSASVELDDTALSGRIRGAGSDSGSGSRTRANATYRVDPDPAGSRVSLSVDYNLQGSLAQFSRSGLAQDLGRRLVAEFASNLNASLGREQERAPRDAVVAPLDAIGLLAAGLKKRVLKLLRKFSRSSEGT
jgi:carbon-monoxide dehydrogenase small subunit